MDEKLGTDLSVVPHFQAHDASEVDLVRRPSPTPSVRLRDEARYDLGTLTGRENLAQALILRMLIPRGSLSDLGHARYGSQLHTLIGRRKTEALRNLCRAFVLEVVAQEPRVEDTAVALAFDPEAETSSSFVFTLSVKPLEGDALNLSLEVGI